MCSSGEPINACKNKSWEMGFEGHLIFYCVCVCVCDWKYVWVWGRHYFSPIVWHQRSKCVNMAGVCSQIFVSKTGIGKDATYHPNFCLLVLGECIKSCCVKLKATPVTRYGSGGRKLAAVAGDVERKSDRKREKWLDMWLSDIKHPATVSYDTDTVGVGLAPVTRTTIHCLINTSHTSSLSPRYPVRLTLTPLPWGPLRSFSI